VVAASDDVNARGEKFIGNFWSDAKPRGGIFAIGDDEISARLAADPREVLDYELAARRPDQIADEKNSHGA
jgi:hypothetical protein